MKTLAMISYCLLAATAAATTGAAQQPHRSVTGKYTGQGCSLEAARLTSAAATDSAHVQLICNHGPPGYHIGFFDAVVQLTGDTAVYVPARAGDRAASRPCRIRIRFLRARAVVDQRGTDSDCGFGAFVTMNATLRRVNSRVPAFDLNPVNDAGAH